MVCPEKNLAGDLAARFSVLLGLDQVKIFSDSNRWIVRLTAIDPDLEETARHDHLPLPLALSTGSSLRTALCP